MADEQILRRIVALSEDLGSIAQGIESGRVDRYADRILKVQNELDAFASQVEVERRIEREVREALAEYLLESDHEGTAVSTEDFAIYLAATQPGAIEFIRSGGAEL